MINEFSQPSLNELREDINNFMDEFGEYIENCFDEVFDLLNKSNSVDTLANLYEIFLEFASEYADDLDACQPEAFDQIEKIVGKVGIEL